MIVNSKPIKGPSGNRSVGGKAAGIDEGAAGLSPASAVRLDRGEFIGKSNRQLESQDPR
jgi:hypothetical protein